MSEATRPARGLVLVGYRGTGKSTVGRLLAKRLALPFVDADHELERSCGQSIRAIFDERGEPYFRDREEETLRRLTEIRTPAVIATGGGAILRESNRAALREFGFVVWLTGSPACLADRLLADPAGRPALTTAGTIEEIAEVLTKRLPLYEQSCDAKVSTDKRSPVDVAEAILALLPADFVHPSLREEGPRL